MNSINLLPKKLGTKNRKLMLAPLMIAFTVVLLAIQYFYYITWDKEAKDASMASVQLEQQISELRDNGELRAKVDGYKQAEQLINQLQLSRPDWKPYTDVIIGSLPSTTKIVAMSVNEQTTVINAELDFQKLEEVIRYLKSLEESDQLHEVLLTSYYKKVDDTSTTSTVSALDGVGTVIKTVKKEVYKLLLDIALTNDKGASS